MSAIVKVDKRHHRVIAQEHWGLTDEQMKGMHVHHRILVSKGGSDDPSNLFVCSPWFHAHIWHGEDPWIKAVCTPEARAKSWAARKENWEDVSSAGGKASAIARRARGVTSWGFENIDRKHKVAGGKASSKVLYECPVCGLRANAGNMTRHMKASGHTGERIKVHHEQEALQ